MTLADARVGGVVRVVSFDRPDQAAEAIRLGLVPGSELAILHKVTRGPLVVEAGVNQVAVGYHLARRITVIPLENSH